MCQDHDVFGLAPFYGLVQKSKTAKMLLVEASPPQYVVFATDIPEIIYTHNGFRCFIKWNLRP